jgi:beta-lactamase class A
VSKTLAACRALCLSLLLVAMTSHAAESFDVSYLWHSNEQAVRAYEERVASVLGPGVAKQLRVVRSGKLYGLIYARRGDHAGAVRVANHHAKLLRSRGLADAAVVKRRNWTVRPSAAQPLAKTRKRAARSVEIAIRPAATEASSAAPVVAKAQAVAVPPQAKKTRPAVKSNPGELQRVLLRHVKKLRKKGLIARDERTAWSVYDFSTGAKLVKINEDVPLQAASLIKPFVAAAFLHKVKQGKLKYSAQAKRHMEKMIQRSNNSSTNWIARKVGGPRSVERVLKRRYPGVFTQTHLTEYIPSNGRTYKNRASAHDYSRFLFAMWNKRLTGVSELKRLMALPGPDRIRSRAKQMPNATTIYNKTGSTSRLCGDMGIVVVRDRGGREYPYTFIGIIQKQRRARNYGAWIKTRSKVIGEMSDLVYKHITAMHKISS